MNAYEAKIAERQQRRADRAGRLASLSERYFKAAHSQIAGIPPGQPILVGHHSERGHRRALERHDRYMRKAIDLQKAAGEAKYRAEHPSTAIATADPDAIEKLQAELNEKLRLQVTMKTANQLVRKYRKDPTTGAHMIASATGLGEATALKLFTPDCFGGLGFASYELSNNGANMRRIQGRIDQLKIRATKIEAQEASGAGDKTTEFPGGRLVEALADNRLQIFFDKIPARELRTDLKRSGFRWAPSVGAWQAYLGTNSRWSAERILNLKQETA